MFLYLLSLFSFRTNSDIRRLAASQRDYEVRILQNYLTLGEQAAMRYLERREERTKLDLFSVLMYEDAANGKRTFYRQAGVKSITSP